MNIYTHKKLREDVQGTMGVSQVGHHHDSSAPSCGCLLAASCARLSASNTAALWSHLYAQYPAYPNAAIERACPPISRNKENKKVSSVRQSSKSGEVVNAVGRTVEEVAFLDPQLAKTSRQSEERETHDVGE